MESLTIGVHIGCGYTEVEVDVSDRDYAKLKRIRDLYDLAVEEDRYTDDDVVDPADFFSPYGDGEEIYYRILRKVMPLLEEEAEEFGHEFDEDDVALEFPEEFEEE